MEHFAGIEYALVPEYVQRWDAARAAAGATSSVSQLEGEPGYKEKHYKTAEGQVLLAAVKNYAQEYGADKEITESNIIFVVHPYFKEIMDEPNIFVKVPYVKGLAQEGYNDFSLDQYSEMQEKLHKKEIKQFYRASDEDNAAIDQVYTDNLENLLTKIDREKYNVVLIDIPEHFAFKSHSLVDRGLIDKVVFTQYNVGTLIDTERETFSYSAENIFMTGSYAEACVKEALGAVSMQNSDKSNVSKNLISNAVLTQSLPAADAVGNAYRFDGVDVVSLESLVHSD